MYKGELKGKPNRAGGPKKYLYVVKKSLYSLKELTEAPVVELFNQGDVAVYMALEDFRPQPADRR